MIKNGEYRRLSNTLHSSNKTITDYSSFKLGYFFVTGGSIEDVIDNKQVASSLFDPIDMYKFSQMLDENPDTAEIIFSDFPGIIAILTIYEDYGLDKRGK